MIALFASVLSYSIEDNLETTTQWLGDLGLTKAEVAKVIARCPQVLGYSVQQNLKPTAQWLHNAGLTKGQVARVIALFPQVLGCSIERNLKPTVQWFRDLGLTKAEVASCIVQFPTLLGYSTEKNLKPKVHWLLEQFSSEQVRTLLVCNPRLFSRRYDLLVRRAKILRQCSKLSELGSAMMLTDDKFAKRYEGKNSRCPRLISEAVLACRYAAGLSWI